MSKTMTPEQIKERFFEDIKNHTIKIKHDSGIYRNIKFSNNGSAVMHFNLTTWPGYLCFSGDMGCFVFSREPDMINDFFKHRGTPNLRYWAEKLQAVDSCSASQHFCNGCKDWSSSLFWSELKDYFDDYYEDEAKSKMEEFKNESFFNDSNPYEAHDAVREFDDRLDFWECDCREYTYTYQWACWAIMWGIEQYNKEQEK